MMKKMLILYGLLLLITLADPARAEEPNTRYFYLGVQSGISDLYYDHDSDHLLRTNTAERHQFSGRVYAGYALSEFIATEIGYDYFGKQSIHDKIYEFDQSFIQQGMDLSGKAILPLDYGFAFYLRGGVEWVHRGSLESHHGLFAEEDTSNKITLFGTLGASYTFSKPFAIDFSLTRSLANGELPRMDQCLFGITYRF